LWRAVAVQSGEFRLGTTTQLVRFPAAADFDRRLTSGLEGASWSSGDAMPLRSVECSSGDIRRVRLKMSKWNFLAMGQAGLTGSTRKVAEPVARSIARRTGRSEGEILSLIGAVFLAIAVVDFLRNVDAVIVAGRTGHQPPDAAPAVPGAHR